jgi:glycosyltransferase involved in cell wall biosynthesis
VLFASLVSSENLQDIEFVFIDDASQDFTVEIISAFINKNPNLRVVLLCQQHNHGVSVARNRGIEKALGDWITFIDSDDVIMSSTWTYVMSDVIFQQKDIDIIYSPLKVNPSPIIEAFEGFGPWEHFNRGMALYSFYRTRFDQRIVDVCMGMFFRRKFICENRLLFTPKMIMLEDAEFLGRAYSLAGSCALNNNSFYLYRLHPDSSSGNVRIYDYPGLEGHLEGVRSLKAFCNTNTERIDVDFVQGLIIKFTLLPFQAVIGKKGIDWSKHQWVYERMKQQGNMPVGLNSGNVYLVKWASILNKSVYYYYLRWWLRLLGISVKVRFGIKKE